MLATLISVWLLHVAALLGLGANALLVAQLAASDRARSALLAALGIAVGAALWALCAVLAINAVFEAFPWLRRGLQIAGGLYLLYVASRLWRSNPKGLDESSQSVPSLAAFRLGLLTNVTNPQSALFFSSVFAASFPLVPSLALQVSTVVLVTVNAIFWYSFLAFIFSRQHLRSAYSRRRRAVNRFAAVALGALGVRVLAASLQEARR